MKAKISALLTGDGMKARAIRGTLISFMGFGGSQVIRLGSNLILTRLLVPEAFGLMALVQVVLAGLENFSDVGMRAAIIQSDRGDERRYLDTAWTIQIVRGLFLWMMTWALAIPAAQFYGYPEMATIIPVIGATLLINGFRSTWLIQANRNLYLGPQVTLGVASQFIAAIFMVILAYYLESYWALVYGALIGATLKSIGSHFIIPGKRNGFAWDWPAVRELFHFGKYIFIATIAGYFVAQGDRMILGKFVSLETLALFTIAFFLANVPATLNQQIVSGVLLPLFRNRPPGANPQNRRQIGLAKLGLAVGFMSVAAFTAAIGEVLIAFLYDVRYHGAGAILVVLSLAIMPRLIIAGYNQILLANGNSRDFTLFTIVSAVIRVGLLLILISNFGIIGAVLAPFLVDIIIYPLLVYYIRPYHGWYGGQDLILFSLALAFSALILWTTPAAFELLLVLAPG